MSQLERDREVQTFEELHESRLQRQSLWQNIVKDWIHGDKSLYNDPDGYRQLGLADGNSDSLQFAYEESVKKSDDVADGLRENADVVAKKVAFQTSVARKRRIIETQTRHLDDNRIELESQNQAWQKLWQPLGIVTKSTSEMLDWRARAEQARGVAQQLRTKRLESELLKERINNHVDRLRMVLETTQPKSRDVSLTQNAKRLDSAQESLGNILKIAKRRLSELQNEQSQRAMKITTRDNLLMEQRLAAEHLMQCENALIDWRKAWAHPMKRLNLDESATPAQAESVLGNLQQLFVEHSRAKELNNRIDKMTIDIKNFESELMSIVNRFSP